jgi:hypothetical protein
VTEVVCFGMRTRDPTGARAALLRAHAGESLVLVDAGRGGLWVRGGPELLELAARWPRELGAPVRCYRVGVTSERGGLRVRASGCSFHPDGGVTPIASATEDDLDHERGDPGQRAADRLAVALEVHEALEVWDAAVEAWPDALR